MKVSLAQLEVAAVLGIGLLGALYIWKKGGLVQAASGAGAAVVNGAAGVATGAIGAAGVIVGGLPTPDETTTDPAVARYLIDTAGYGFASKWSGLPALVAGAMRPAGSGLAPPASSAVAQALIAATPQMTTGDFSRLDRLSYSPGNLSTNGYADDGAVYDVVSGVRIY